MFTEIRSAMELTYQKYICHCSGKRVALCVWWVCTAAANTALGTRGGDFAGGVEVTPLCCPSCSLQREQPHAGLRAELAANVVDRAKEIWTQVLERSKLNLVGLYSSPLTSQMPVYSTQYNALKWHKSCARRNREAIFTLLN